VRQAVEEENDKDGRASGTNGTMQNVLGWFKWVPQWPLLSSLRRLNLH